jgi:hypothetical protein
MEVLIAKRANLVFHIKVIDGTIIKRVISRLIDHFGMAYASHILDQVKTLGFPQATATSISFGIDDLLTIPSKGWIVQDTEQQSCKFYCLDASPNGSSLERFLTFSKNIYIYTSRSQMTN